jgi:hypothetical protein
VGPVALEKLSVERRAEKGAIAPMPLVICEEDAALADVGVRRLVGRVVTLRTEGKDLLDVQRMPQDDAWRLVRYLQGKYVSVGGAVLAQELQLVAPDLEGLTQRRDPGTGDRRHHRFHRLRIDFRLHQH